jgi:hypothetical protein
MNMPSPGSQMRRRVGVVILAILVGTVVGAQATGRGSRQTAIVVPYGGFLGGIGGLLVGGCCAALRRRRRSPRTLVEKTTYLVAVSLTLLGGYAAIGDLSFVLGVRLGPKRVSYVEDLAQPRHADGRRVSPAFREFEARTFLFWYSLRVQAVKTPWDAGNEERRSVLGSKLTSVPVLPRAWLELAVNHDAYADVESGLKRASRDVELGVGLQQTDIGLARFVSENSWPSLAQISYEANRNLISADQKAGYLAAIAGTAIAALGFVLQFLSTGRGIWRGALTTGSWSSPADDGAGEDGKATQVGTSPADEEPPVREEVWDEIVRSIEPDEQKESS